MGEDIKTVLAPEMLLCCQIYDAPPCKRTHYAAYGNVVVCLYCANRRFGGRAEGTVFADGRDIGIPL